MPQIYKGTQARTQAAHVLAIHNNPIEKAHWISKHYNRIAQLGLVKRHLNEGSNFFTVRDTLRRRYNTFISPEKLLLDLNLIDYDFTRHIQQLKFGAYKGFHVSTWGHGTTLHIIKDKDVTHFIYINLSGAWPEGVHVYSITPNELEAFAAAVEKAFSPWFLKAMNANPDLIREFILNNQDKINIELSKTLSMKNQKVGNCMVASANPVMYLNYTANIMRSYDMSLEQAFTLVKPLYKEVRKQDRIAAFNYLLTHPEYFYDESAQAYDILQCLLKFDSKDQDKHHRSDYIKQIAQQGCYVHMLQALPLHRSTYLNSYIYVKNATTTQLYYIGAKPNKIKKITLKNFSKFENQLQKLNINLADTTRYLTGQEVADLLNSNVNDKDKYYPHSKLILDLLSNDQYKHNFVKYYAEKKLSRFPLPKILIKCYEEAIYHRLQDIEKNITCYNRFDGSYLYATSQKIHNIAPPCNLTTLDDLSKYIQTYYPIDKLNTTPSALFKLILNNVINNLSNKISAAVIKTFNEFINSADINYEEYVRLIAANITSYEELKLFAESVENEFGVLNLLSNNDLRKQDINKIKAEFIKFQAEDHTPKAFVNHNFFQNPLYSKGHFASLMAYAKHKPENSLNLLPS